MRQPIAQSTVHLKSILWKPTCDEAGQTTSGNGGRGTACVKFMLGGEETSRAAQLMVIETSTTMLVLLIVVHQLLLLWI